MRALITSIFVGALALPFFAFVHQDGQDPNQEQPGRRNPFTAHREKEQERLEKEIEGAWMLVSFRNPYRLIDPANIRGFAIFHDGFLSITVQAAERRNSVIRQGLQYYFQAAASRYQINHMGRLQTKGIMGYSNANENGELEFQSALEPREYDIQVDEGRLYLKALDGATFEFSRMRRGEFPEDAVDELNRARNNAPPVPRDGR